MIDQTTSRRDFLAILMAVVFGLQLDPERLFWVPGAKKIFIPKHYPSPDSEIEFLTSDMILEEAMKRYEIVSRKLLVNDQLWEGRFVLCPPKILDGAVRLRLPPRYRI